MGKKTEMIMLKKFLGKNIPQYLITYELPLKKVSHNRGHLSLLSRNTINALTSWKADAVIRHSNGKLDLYEAKLKMDMKQFGQLFCYRFLLAHQEGISEDQIALHAVYIDEEPDLIPIYRSHYIKLHKV